MGNLRKKPRKLTAAEAARKADFDRTAAALYAAGYRSEDLTVGALQANLLAVALCLPIVLALLLAFSAVHPEGGGSFTFGESAWFFALLLLLAFAHEGLHGLCWAAFAPDRWKAISFGLILRYLTPYCACRQPLSRGAYALGGMLPMAALGLLPAAVSIATGSAALWWIGAVMIFAGGADLLIFLKLMRFRPGTRDAVYLDHPYECGLVAFLRDPSPSGAAGPEAPKGD